MSSSSCAGDFLAPREFVHDDNIGGMILHGFQQRCGHPSLAVPHGHPPRIADAGMRDTTTPAHFIRGVHDDDSALLCENAGGVSTHGGLPGPGGAEQQDGMVGVPRGQKHIMKNACDPEKMSTDPHGDAYDILVARHHDRHAMQRPGDASPSVTVQLIESLFDDGEILLGHDDGATA